jgi:hypothetical protein
MNAHVRRHSPQPRPALVHLSELTPAESLELARVRTLAQGIADPAACELFLLRALAAARAGSTSLMFRAELESDLAAAQIANVFGGDA